MKGFSCFFGCVGDILIFDDEVWGILELEIRLKNDFLNIFVQHPKLS